MLSWKVLKYIKTDPYDHFFTKPLTAIRYQFQQDQCTMINNTLRYFRNGTINTEPISLDNNDVLLYNETESAYETFSSIYNLDMFPMQEHFYDILANSIDSSINWAGLTIGLVNINTNQFLRLQIFMENKKTGLVEFKTIYQCFDPLLFKAGLSYFWIVYIFIL